MRRLLLITVGLVVALSSVAMSADIEFRTNGDSAGIWTRDADLREQGPTQKRGTLTSMTFGLFLKTFPDDTLNFHPIVLDTIVFTGDTLMSPGNGIPSGKTITACTLWVKLQSQTISNVSEIIFDLYGITQGWNEVDPTNAVSWNNRIDNTAWTTEGGTRTLALADAFSYQRINGDSFFWRTEVSSVLTKWKDKAMIVADGDTMPIPIPLTLAQEIYAGTKNGALFKVRDSVVLLTFIINSSESATSTSRPQWSWWYEVAASPPLLLPRRRRLRKIGI